MRVFPLRPRVAVLLLVSLAAVPSTVRPLVAQATPDAHAHRAPRRVPLHPQWEMRAEAVAAESPSALAAVGVNVRAGWYVRLGGALGGGVRQLADDRHAGFLRADATVRFLLDPFAERRRGLYGGIGLSAVHTGAGLGAEPPVLLLLAGAESKPRAGRAWAVEVGVGGGVRLGVVRRAARRDGYR